MGHRTFIAFRELTNHAVTESHAIRLLITWPAVFAEAIAAAHEELSAELLTGVLSKLRGMVTVMTTDGHVIYQNAASIAGMGNLQRHTPKPAGFLRARRLGAADTDDAMQRIFQAAPDKLEEMQEAIEAGKVRCLRCWPGSVASMHVACGAHA